MARNGFRSSAVLRLQKKSLGDTTSKKLFETPALQVGIGRSQNTISQCAVVPEAQQAYFEECGIRRLFTDLLVQLGQDRPKDVALALRASSIPAMYKNVGSRI